MVNAIAEGRIQVMPEVLVNGGGGSIDGLAATLIKFLRDGRAVVDTNETDPPGA